MALDNFKKTIWVAGILTALKKSHVFASLSNTNYQGELKNLGDRVRIMGISEVNVASYTKDTDIASPTDLQDAVSELIADQAYYFNFKVNDVDAVQEKPLILSETTATVGYKFRDKVDRYFAGLHSKTGYQLYSTGTTPYTVTSTNADDVLLDAAELFGANNIPREGRFMVIPEWFHSKLVLAGLSIRKENNELFDNGYITRVLGWDLYLSNNLSEASANTDVKIIAGIKKQSLSFAEVISKIEAYRPEKRFEDAVKGLYVFGGKIIRPDMTACIHVTKGSN